jgi:hypothetical protein
VFFIAYCFTYFVELFIASLFQFRINCDKQLVGVCLGFFQFLFTCAETFQYPMDHSYSYPYQQYQEEPPSQTMAASEEIMDVSTEACARLERTMLAFLSEAEEDRQEFARINNSITQSYEKMDVHFKQMMDILKEEKCQGQLVANLNEYYMENECIYYHEQTTTTPRNEETVKDNFCEPSLEDPLGEHFDQFYEQVVVENQVDEMKEEQIEDLEETH